MTRKTKILMIISGILMILAGVALLCNPGATVVSVAWLIGLFTVVSGIMAITFYCTTAKSFLGGSAVLFDGIIGILLGLLCFGNSFIMARTLIFLFGLWLAVSGIERLVHSIDMKKLYFKYWWAELILGILCAVLGICSIFIPAAGAVAISALLGIGFILHGITYFTIVWGINNINKM